MVLAVVWSMVGINKSVKLGVSHPLEDGPVRHLNEPLPEKEETCIGDSNQNYQTSNNDKGNVLSLKVTYITIRKPHPDM